MRIVGVTGGIGSGKSTIVHELSRRGYRIYDCDKEAKRIIEEDASVRGAITALFGSEAYIADVSGETHYNTAYISAQVFANPELRLRLNAIVHPAVAADIEAAASETDSEVLFVETAILYQSGLYRMCEMVVWVDAPEDIRVKRTLARDYQGDASPVNTNKVRARMHTQENEYYAARQEQIPVLRICNDGEVSIEELADIIEARLSCGAGR